MMLAQSHMTGQTATSALLYQQLLLTMTQQFYDTCNIPAMYLPATRNPTIHDHKASNANTTQTFSRVTDTHSARHNYTSPTMTTQSRRTDNVVRHKTISSEGNPIWRPSGQDFVHTNKSRVNENQASSKRKFIEVDADGALDLSMKKIKQTHNCSPVNTKLSGVQHTDGPLDFSVKRSNHTTKHSAAQSVHSNLYMNGFNTFKNTASASARNTSISAANPTSRKSNGSCKCNSGKDIWCWSVEEVCSFLKTVDGCTAYVKVIKHYSVS